MNLALFDFDGTISFGDTWTPFIRFATGPVRGVAGLIVLSPVAGAYKAGAISASVGRRAVARIAFGGRREGAVREAGARYARTVLPGVIRPEALARITWHKQQGDRVVVVSASLDVYLSPWCRQHQIDLICSELEASRGRMTGGYRGADCVRAEKSRRVQSRYDLAAYRIVYAYGDTDDDRDMLALAHRRFFRWREETSGAVVRHS